MVMKKSWGQDPARDAWKARLPRPYDQDLSKVLGHLNRRTRRGRARLANDPVTASYLKAGMRLLAQHLGPGARPRDLGEPVLGFPSQRAVAAAVAGNPVPFGRRGTVASLRDRWKAQSDFVADLINFAVWRENYRPDHQELRATAREELVRACPADLRGVARGVWCVLSACARISLVLDVLG